MLKKTIAIISALIILLEYNVYAADTISIVQVKSNDTSIFAYINTEINECKVTLGSVPCEVISYSRSGDLPSNTLILVDTSGSIPKEVQDKTEEFLAELIDGKNENERYAIASFGTQINYMCEYTSDRYELSKAVDRLEYNEKYTYIYSLLEEILKHTDKDVFTRIVIISDGVENSRDGITYDEILRTVSESCCPVYTIGIENNNQEALKRFYSFARNSGGSSCSISSDTDVSEVCGIVNESREFTCINVKIPEELADGSLRYLSISGENFKCGMDIRMPVLAVAPRNKEETFTTAESIMEDLETTAEDIALVAEADSKGKNDFMGIYIAMVIIGGMAVISAVVMLIISARGRKKPAEPVPAPPDPSPTVFAQIKFTDVNNPETIYQCGLEKKITVGRDRDQCMIAIDGDFGISRRHFTIEKESDRFILKNVSTTRSVYINGKKLPKISTSTENASKMATAIVIDPGTGYNPGINRAEVKSGDIIRISKTELKLEIKI